MKPSPERRRVHSHEVPSLGLDELRARNDFKLKSTLEILFEKYGRDFTGVGDEIDLETGEIVVNNGHLLGMRDEVDVGYDKDDTEGDELANDLLSDVGREDLPVEYMEKSMDVRHEEQEQPTATAGPEASPSFVDDVDSFMGDIQDDDSIPPERNYTRAIIDLQLNSEPGNPGRALGSMGVNAHLVPPNITSSGSSLSYGDRVISQLGVDNPDPYDAVVEPAWRAPSLPIRFSGSGTSAALTSLPYRKDIGRQRSLSPTRGSLWAPGKTPGRLRKDSRGIRLPKLVSNTEPTAARQPWEELGTVPKWSAEEDSLLLHLKAPTELEFHKLETHVPGRTWDAIKHRSHVIGARKHPWTEGEDRLLWHLETNTELSEREMVPYFSGKSLRQIRYRWVYSKGFARNKETFNATLSGTATVQDDQWLQELIANSMLPPAGQDEGRPLAKSAQNPIQYDENLLPGGEVNNGSAKDRLQRDSTTAAGLDTELGLNLDIAHDAVDIKEELPERALSTPTKKSAAQKPIEKPSPLVVLQSPHHNGDADADAVVPRYSSPTRPKPNLIHRPSKPKRRTRQSTHSNVGTDGAKLHQKVKPSTPFRSQRHPDKSTKPPPASSLTSMLGYDSEEDELSWLGNTVGTPNVGPVLTSLSTARKCGTPGFKCTRSVCLRCA